MPDFIPVLATGLIVFAALIMAFGGFIVTDSSSTGGGGTYTGHGVETRHILFDENFTVGFLGSEKKLTKVQGIVSHGLASSYDKRVSFSVSNPADITQGILKIYVSDTNLYGRLNFYLNEKLVYSNYSYIGTHTVKIDKDLFTSDSVLTATADSSGWRIWAPTTYNFNASLSANYLGAVNREYKFDMTEAEIDDMDSAKLNMRVGSRTGTGQMTVMLNGNEIYVGTNTTLSKAIDRKYFVEGTNEIEMSSSLNTNYYITSAGIDLTFNY